jgi:hypothetical protein
MTLLREVRKGVGADDMLAAGRRLLQADESVCMVLLGLAGQGPRSHEHARATEK